MISPYTRLIVRITLLIVATCASVLVGRPVQASDLKDMLPLTNQVLIVHFDDGYVIHHQRGQHRSEESAVVDPLNLTKASLLSSYQLSSGNDARYASPLPPLDLGRKTKGTEFTWLCQSYNNGCINTDPDHAQEHWIYLYLPHALQAGKQYTLTLAGLTKNQNTLTFTYDETALRSEAIHVNNLGYAPAAPAKYAYLYHWAGDKGAFDLSAFNGKPFQLFNTETKQVAYSGSIAFRKAQTNTETGQPNETPNNNFMGADVYECDFSAFQTPGKYVLVVPGMGSSFPFEIGADVYREAYFWTMKGLYQNRSGIELKAPFTDFPRPAPHNPNLTPGFAGKLKYSTFRTFDLSSYDGGESDKANIEAAAKGDLNTFGWYQDAGDWDGYYTHSHVPAFLLFLYEAGRNKFTDHELNIPESGNGIPDILDEAAWLLRYYKRTKDAVKAKGWGTGGVAGARVFGDLWGGDERADGTTKGSWEDTDRTWYVLGEDPWTTYKYAALAAQMAYVLASEGKADPEGVDWQKEAIDAYEWAVQNTRSGDETPRLDVDIRHVRLYAAAALYRLTNRKKYHDAYISGVSTLIGNDIDQNKTDLMFASWLYLRIPSNRTSDGATLSKVRTAVTQSTENILVTSAESRACRWGGNFYFPMLVGQASTPMITMGIYGFLANQAAHSTKANQYLKYIYTTADYYLGTNPLNTTWISGVGERHPVGVFHLDWWYSGKPGLMKGIVPYGPWKAEDFGPLGPWNPNWAYSDKAGNARIYPANIGQWPGHERWFDQRTAPIPAEFTIHQNTVIAAFVYGFLTNDQENKTLLEVPGEPDAPLAVDKPSGEEGFEVFPNPASDWATLAWPAAHGRLQKMVVSSLEGKTQFAIRWQPAENGYLLNVSALGAGCYILSARTDKGLWLRRKLLVVRK